MSDLDQMLVLNRQRTAVSVATTPVAAAPAATPAASARPPFHPAPSSVAAMSSPAGMAAIAAATGGAIDSSPPQPTSTLSLARTASTPARGGLALSFREPPGSLSLLAKTEGAAAAAAAVNAASNPLPPAAASSAASTPASTQSTAAAAATAAAPPGLTASASFDPSRLVLHTPPPRNPLLLRGPSKDPTIAAADRALSLASPSHARAQAQAQAQAQQQAQAQAQRTASLASSTLNNRPSASGGDSSSAEPSLSEQRRSSTSANDSSSGQQQQQQTVARATTMAPSPSQQPQQQPPIPALRPNTLPPLAFQPPQPALASGASFPMLMPPQQLQSGQSQPQLQPQQSLAGGPFPRPVFQPMMVMMYPPPPGAFGGSYPAPPQMMQPQQSMMQQQQPQQQMQMQPQQQQPMMQQQPSSVARFPSQAGQPLQQQQTPQSQQSTPQQLQPQQPPTRQQQQQQNLLSPPPRPDLLQRQQSEPPPPNPAMFALRPRTLVTGDSSLPSGSSGGGGGAGGGGNSPPKSSPSGSRPLTPPRSPNTKVVDLSLLPSLRSKPTLTEMELSRARRIERDRTMFLLWILAALVMLTLCFHIHRFSFDKAFYARFSSAALAIAIVSAIVLLWPIGMIFLGRSMHETTPSTVLVHAFLGWLVSLLLYLPVLTQAAPGAAAIEAHRSYSIATQGRAVEFSANSSGAIAAALALHLISLTAFYILLLQIVTGEHRGAEGGMTMRERSEFHAALAAVQDFDTERREWVDSRESMQKRMEAQSRSVSELTAAHKRTLVETEHRLTEALQARDQLTAILDGLEVSKGADGRASTLAAETIGHIRKNHEFEIKKLLDEAQARQRMTLALSKELDLTKQELQTERSRAAALQTEQEIMRLQLSNAGLEQSRLIDLQRQHELLTKEFARVSEVKTKAEALVLLASKGSCVGCAQWSERFEEQRQKIAAQDRVAEENLTLKAALLTAQNQLATAARRDLARDSRTRRKVDKIQRDLHEFDLFTQEHEPTVPDEPEEFEIRYAAAAASANKKTA